ncbi:glycosyltransferase involved in cell wall biosynthesis [Desulfobaculum xiamenense]|uniref:Glycosyltransferase involved in cell wall biosynthesis n=1 Tax=Desulfobaculum xiamenense TaxID=995050 RepID=A0A846QKS0_9BACT|nr:glycosyltransferase [Desulfobaculum xiamenense]NJB67650.1 glycosyltransferase involved in cell wall biosynthesis [Desulfobaculum xiamenense]
MKSASIVIPTYNRPAELEACLRSILGQSVAPLEVIVVDDGNLAQVPLAPDFETRGIRLVLHRKDRPGLTESRNVGATLARGDVILYLDDDTVLFADYVEQLLAVYEHRDVGGVGGIIDNPKPMRLPHHIRYLYDLVFLNRGLREGRVLPSGFCTDFGTTWFPVRETREADFVDGGVSSFRREIFADMRFTERYREFGLGEDKDFSIRVARRYGLAVTPNARLLHHESPKMRPDKRLWGRKFVLGRYLFFRDHVRTKWWSWLAFAWALAGYLLARTIIAALSLRRDEFRRVAGILGAARDIALGRISLSKADNREDGA